MPQLTEILFAPWQFRVMKKCMKLFGKIFYNQPF